MELPDDPVADADRLLRSGRFIEALGLAEEAWRRLGAQGDRLARAHCRRIMAAAHQVSGNLGESILCGYDAIELFESLDSPYWFSRTLSMQAVSLARHGDSGESVRLVHRATVLLDQVSDPAQAAAVLNNISVVYESLGQLGNAVDALERAIPLARAGDDEALQMVCTCNLWMYRLSQAREASEDAHDRATLEALHGLAAHMSLCETAGRHHLVGAMADQAGAVMAAIGQLDRAEAVLSQGLHAVRTAGLGPEQARLLLGLATVARLARRFDAASRHMAEALALAIEGDDKDLVSRCHFEESMLCEASGDLAGALASFKRHAQVHEGILRARAALAVEVVSARMVAERSKLQAQLLQARNNELQHEVKQLASEAQQLLQHAEIDPLTGLGNRRHFQRRIGELQAEAARLGWNAVVLMQSDIDHFKRINDTWSHAVGDLVLKEIGVLLQKSCRPYDVVARFGGEEFVIAFGGGLTLDMAHTVAERIRANIEAHDWQAIQPGLAVTISLGLALPNAGESVDETLSRADAALYVAKRSGRNRVCIAND